VLELSQRGRLFLIVVCRKAGNVRFESGSGAGGRKRNSSLSVALGFNFIKVQCGLVHHMDARGWEVVM
jgi:hypothetical protein